MNSTYPFPARPRTPGKIENVKRDASATTLKAIDFGQQLKPLSKFYPDITCRHFCAVVHKDSQVPS